MEGGKLGPFMQFLAADEGLGGCNECVCFWPRMCGTCQPNCLQSLDLLPFHPTAILSWVQPHQEFHLRQGSSQMQCL